MIVVTGYAVATAPPVYAVVRRLAAFPSTGPGAAAYVGLFSMLASLLSWSFSLIFSGLLAKEVAHRVKGSDYRAIGAAAYLGRRQRVGAGAVVVGRADHGVVGVAARCGGEDQRRHPAQPDAGPLAEPAHRRRAHRRLDGRCPTTPPRRPAWPRGWPKWACAYERVSHDIGARAHAGRMARVQPVPDDRDRAAGIRLPGARGLAERPGHPAAAEPVHLHVPGGGPAAALAAQVVRAGDRRGDHARRAAC